MDVSDRGGPTGASSGISYFINQQGKYRHYDNVFAGIIMIGLIGLAFDQSLAYLAKFLFPWQPSVEGGGLIGWTIGAVTYLPRRLLARRRRPSPPHESDVLTPIPATPPGGDE